jgi:hypothetical protein
LEFVPLFAILTDMAKIFYLGGGTPPTGMLRAVLSVNQLELLLSPEFVIHLGSDFPETSDAAMTLIEISHEEGTSTWPAGFSRVPASPSDFDERLRFLPEQPGSRTRATSNVRSGSALIHWLTRDIRSN